MASQYKLNKWEIEAAYAKAVYVLEEAVGRMPKGLPDALIQKALKEAIRYWKD